MTEVASPTRAVWTEHARADGRLLLVVDVRAIAGVAVALSLAGAPLVVAPLGRLGSPFAMLLVLPPLALALEAFGWRDRLARRLGRIRRPLARLLATYAMWLVMSSLLTLDVAAVAAASVGIAVAAEREEERRWQLGSAILGANGGSLLFPFSNLTNLVLVAATGVGFAAYTALAVGPELAVALALGMLLAWRARHAIHEPARTAVALPERPVADGPGDVGPATRAAGGVALAGALAAIATGLMGADVAVPFAISSAILTGAAVAGGRLDPRAIVRSIPLTGLGVIMLAAVAGGPIAVAASLLPRPDDSASGLVLALVVGGVLAAIANNLPAAAFGSVWLVGSHPAAVVAYLLGTNVVALATPHGSVATILARDIGKRQGVTIRGGRYVRSAWPYAVAGAAAGIIALALVAR